MIANETRYKAKLIFDFVFIFIGIIALISFILAIGFHLTPDQMSILATISDILALIFIIQELLRWFYVKNKLEYLFERWFEMLIVFLLLLHLLFPDGIYSIASVFLPNVQVKHISLLYIAIISLVILFVFIIKSLRYNHLLSKIKLHPGAIFSLSFLFVILLGAIALMLPKATPADNPISFIDALFTSTSAVCVTGLITVDTATAFTLLGKFLIICLIQIGGLGVMTLTTFFAIVFAGGLSVKVRVMLKDMLSQESVVEVWNLLFKIFLLTLSIELVGAFLLYFSLGGEIFHFDKVLFYSCAFHSVSAFCNAGFSLYSVNLMQSGIVDNYFFLTVIMLLIIFGGLGFTTVANISSLFPWKNDKRTISLKFSLMTKIILLTTLILIVAGSLLIFSAESYDFTKGLSVAEKFFHSVFLSVTARTAGFNSVAMELLSYPTVMLLIVLMWIGASPGSTGGGIKTTTIAITIMALFNLIRGKERVEFGNREIAPHSIHNAFLVVIASLIVLGAGSTLLVWMEPDKNPIDLIFEATSAISTVGLSRNITFYIGDGSKIVLILLMFIGRIGVLTFFMSLYRAKPEPRYQLPKEQIIVG